MGKCADYATGKLDLDLDDEVPRTALADCLDSGWSADEIAEELGLEGASAVVSWCLYHDLPLPREAAAAKAPQVPASQPPALQDPAPKRPKRAATPKKADTAPPPLSKREERAALDAVIAQRYQAGEGGYTIARSLKISCNKVYDALKRQGVALRPQQPAMRAEEVVKLYRAGASTASLAKRYGVTVETVTKTLNGQGIKTKHQLALEASVTRRQHLERVAVLALHKAGAGKLEIARLLKLSDKRISALLDPPKKDKTP